MKALVVECRYILSYNSHQMKDIFNVHTLDLLAVARSFGFSQPPKVRSHPVVCNARARSLSILSIAVCPRSH